MSLSHRWVGPADYETVAHLRMMAFATSTAEIERFRESVRGDTRSGPGDFLVVERDGRPVGTATALRLRLWMRGTCFPAQGVAYVGTAKTHRRAARIGQAGIASTLMNQVIRQGRDRGDVLSILGPFRASFYQHFGYGIVEYRHVWRVGLSILPQGDTSTFDEYVSADQPQVEQCFQQQVEAGQCQVERPSAVWQYLYTRNAGSGMQFVDRTPDARSINGWLHVIAEQQHGRRVLRVDSFAAPTRQALVRQLCFLGSLRDQYAVVQLSLPADLPLGALLREPHVSADPADWAAPDLRCHSRMMIRVLDHKRLLEGLHWPVGAAGRATIAVHETEGDVSRFQVEVGDGRASVRAATHSADIECDAPAWAAVATGAIRASTAQRWGLLVGSNDAAVQLLDALSHGPAPYCTDWF